MKSNKTLIIIVIVVLVVLASGYLWFSSNEEGNLFDGSSETNKVAQKDLTETEKVEATIEQMETNSETKEELSDEMKDYYNEDHAISMQYSADWFETDLGGDKNITTPLLRENIVYFYLPESETDSGNEGSAIASIKLLRFVLEDGVNIGSASDWYDYIKTKVNEFIDNTVLSENYELTNIEIGEEIDGKYTVVEDYVESGLVTGKDYYIYNGDEFYQFVTKAPSKYFSKYWSAIQKTVNSFSIGQ